MTPQQVVGTALRLFALWLAVSSVKYLLTIPIALAAAKLGDNNVYSYAAGITYIVAAAILWFFSMWFANKIVPRAQFDNHINLQPLEAARVGCALIGLWVFAKALPDLVWFIFRSVAFYSTESSFQTLDSGGKLDLAVSIFEIMFSLALVFRSSDFAKLMVRQERV